MDLETVIEQIRRQWRLFSAVAGACVALSVVVALLSRPVYRGETVVAPVAEDPSMSSLSGALGQLGGLASLAGGLIGKGKSWDEAIAVLKSRHVIEELVRRDTLIPILFPKGRWELRQALGGGHGPTMGDAVLAMQKRVLQVREDPKSGLVTVRIDWFDPQLAAKWANDLVAIADAELRAAAVADAQASLNVLQHELETAQGVELHTAISHLVESQLKARMVAGVRAHFQYKIIDEAVPADPDKRVQPTRTTMVIAGTLAGLLLATLVVMRRYRRSIRE